MEIEWEWSFNLQIPGWFLYINWLVESFKDDTKHGSPSFYTMKSGAVHVPLNAWWLNQPLWKMMEFVSWDDDIPDIWKVIKFMFQTIDQPFFGEFSLPPLITKGYVLVFSLSGWRDAISLMNYPQWKSQMVKSLTLPSGNLTVCYWKWPIYSELSHEKWWFSIVMLVYQRQRVNMS